MSFLNLGCRFFDPTVKAEMDKYYFLRNLNWSKYVSTVRDAVSHMIVKKEGIMKTIRYIVCIFPLLFICRTALAGEHPVNIYFEKKGENAWQFYAHNTEPIPYTVKLEFTEFRDLESEREFPFFTVVPAYAKKHPVLLIRNKKGKHGYFKYMFYYYMGNCLSFQHDDTYKYWIPYEHGTKYKVTQSYNGGLSHIGDNRFSVDFIMPEGVKIHAARGGTVAGIKEDSNIGGMDLKYTLHGNYVTVYHEDGSFAQYIHLKKNGAHVKKGDIVKPGDLIGYSGNTGRSDAPHLHFEVQVPAEDGKQGYKLLSIPVKFHEFDGSAVEIQPSTWYYASHPGKADFEVNLGRILENNDLESYNVAAEKTEMIDVRYEKLDDTYILYAQNGFDRKVKITLDFDLRDMVMSRSDPLIMELPAQKEVFLCLIRPRRPKGPADWRFEYNFYYKYNYEFLQ